LAETEDRRRVQHEGKAFLILAISAWMSAADLLGAAVALVERLSDRKGNGIIGVLVCCVGLNRSADYMGDTVCAERDVLHPLQHGIGAL